MGRKFRELQPDAGWLFPPSPRDGLPEDRLVNYLRDVTGRKKHSDPVPKVPKSPGAHPPKNQTLKQKMARRNRTIKGRAKHARRKVIIEPVFGQIKSSLGFRDLLCCEGLRRCKANGNGPVPFTICSSYSGAVRLQLADQGKKGPSALTRQCIDDKPLTQQASQPLLSHLPIISRQTFFMASPNSQLSHSDSLLDCYLASLISRRLLRARKP